MECRSSGNGMQGCVILENPCGGGLVPRHTLADLLQKIFHLSSSTTPPPVFSDAAKTSPLNLEALDGLSGNTVYV